MPATDMKGRAILSQFADDIRHLFNDAPAFGTLSFQIVFYNGTPTRFVSGIEVSHLAGTTDDR